MNPQRILTINPGSTSTKISTFLIQDEKLVKEYVQNIQHDAQELMKYEDISLQKEFRKRIIVAWLQEKGVPLDSIRAVAARGGLVRPIPSGVYRINPLMLEHLEKQLGGKHASNLGGLIANALLTELQTKDAFIVDPVVVDEMDEVARLSGIPEIPRRSIFHALNQKAIAMKYAEEKGGGRRYEELNLVVVHMGGGISVAAHKRGRIVDVNDALHGDGTFTPERSGAVPAADIIDFCFSGKYTQKELHEKIKGKGGLYAYLQTKDAVEVEKRIEAGDAYAKLVYEALAYQIAKEIGAYAAVLSFDVDAIILTGGLAYGKEFCNDIETRVKRVAPVHRYPGGDEEWSLASGVYNGLTGRREVKEYTPAANDRTLENQTPKSCATACCHCR